MVDGRAQLPGPTGVLAGRMPVPPSKSLTNRALIAAAAANEGVIVDPLDCEDTRLLAAGLKMAGWSVKWSGKVITIGPMTSVDSLVTVNLGNSGTGAGGATGGNQEDGRQRRRIVPQPQVQGRLQQTGHGFTATATVTGLRYRDRRPYPSAVSGFRGGVFLFVVGLLVDPTIPVFVRDRVPGFGGSH